MRKRRTLVGEVVSDKMDKTILVLVKRRTLHRQYKKYIIKRKRYKAHDENNECTTGDRVIIIEERPLSREKRWRVLRIIKKS